jgi:hypothetical protein
VIDRPHVTGLVPAATEPFDAGAVVRQVADRNVERVKA